MGAVWISRTKQWFWARMARAMHLEYKLPSVPQASKKKWSSTPRSARQIETNSGKRWRNVLKLISAPLRQPRVLGCSVTDYVSPVGVCRGHLCAHLGGEIC